MSGIEAEIVRLQDRVRELEVMYNDLLLALKEAAQGKWARADRLIARHR